MEVRRAERGGRGLGSQTPTSSPVVPPRSPGWGNERHPSGRKELCGVSLLRTEQVDPPLPKSEGHFPQPASAKSQRHRLTRNPTPNAPQHIRHQSRLL